MLAKGLRENESERAPSVGEFACVPCFSEALWFPSSNGRIVLTIAYRKDGTGCAQGDCPHTCLVVCFMLLLWLIVS